MLGGKRKKASWSIEMGREEGRQGKESKLGPANQRGPGCKGHSSPEKRWSRRLGESGQEELAFQGQEATTDA